MARSVVWAETAWHDLEEVADFITKDSAVYAAAFVREARESTRLLSQFPERGAVVPELHDSKLREILVRNYRLIYEVTTDEVRVLGFIHGARDLAKAWKTDDRI